MWDWLPGHSGKPANGQQKIEAVVDARLATGPKGMTQCRCRRTAQNQKVKSPINPSGRVKPHATSVKAFKLSPDAKSLEKLTDVVDSSEAKRAGTSCGVRTPGRAGV